VPHVAPLQPVPESFQLTPLLELSLVTVAVNVFPCPTCTDAAVGATLTAIAAGVGAGAGAESLELELTPAQPYSNIRATRVMPKKDRGARSARARFTAKVLPRFNYWILT
jgi:hypothetical protein